MKLLLILLFVGSISAALHEALEKASDDFLEEFKRSLYQAPPLYEALGLEDSELVRRVTDDIREELIEHVKKVFKNALEKISKAITDGKDINQEAVERLKKLQEKLHELQIEDHEVEGFKDQVSDHVRKILEKMGLTLDKRDVDDEVFNSMLPDLDLRNFFLKIKAMILEKMNVGSLKGALAKLVGQASDKMCQWLTEKGQEKILNFFDRFLESDVQEEEYSEVDKRSASDLYDQVKEYLDRLELELHEKYGKFRDWVKKVLETGLDKSRNKIENVKHIARELLKKSKEVSKEVAAEALEYLHQYKEELGSLYDEVRNKVMNKLMEHTD